MFTARLEREVAFMPSLSGKTKPVRFIDSPLRRDRVIGNPSVQVPKRFTTNAVLCHSNPDRRSPAVQLEKREDDTAPVRDQEKQIEASNLVIRQQLARMLKSRLFIQSDKLSRFLRFIVEHVVEGNQVRLKEYVIGSEVYDRKPPYHPSQDSIVRTEARRLRSKLKEYYELEGQNDPLYVYLRPGSYVPVFRYKEDSISLQNRTAQEGFLLSANTSSIAIAILPFTDISENAVSLIYARGVADELAYMFMRTAGCTVISPSAVAHFCAQEDNVTGAMQKAGAQIAYEGSVRVKDNHLRVTARIIDATGSQLWVKRIDAEIDTQTMFSIEEQIASALFAGFDALFGQSLRLSIS
jgi:TolB-like protein